MNKVISALEACKQSCMLTDGKEPSEITREFCVNHGCVPEQPDGSICGILLACEALTVLRSGELVVNEWISIKDRMPPDDNCWVLVCADGAMNVMAWDDGKWRDWVKARNSNIVVSEITHWMPLPAEPISKEASDNE